MMAESASALKPSIDIYEPTVWASCEKPPSYFKFPALNNINMACTTS
jgi:hypothetical protein